MFGKIKFFFANEFFHNPIIQWLLIVSLFFNLVDWGLLAYFIRPSESAVILHYNVFFGVDILGEWWQAFLLTGTGTLFLLTNLLLAYLFYQGKERIASYLFLLGTFFIQLGILISCAAVIRINY